MLEKNLIDARINAFYKLIFNPNILMLFYEDNENCTCVLGKNNNKPGTYHFLQMDTVKNEPITEKDYKEEELTSLAMQIALTMNENCKQFLYLDNTNISER